jgi:putative nucleotidyltransferase with HDIG domain
LDRDKAKYISSHSIMVAHISGTLAAGMTWSSDLTFEKLTYAALLHDVTIKSQALAAVENLKELEDRRKEFSDAEYKTYTTHAHDAAELAASFPEIPPDVSLIIREHHERPDGTGFPRKLTSSRISPLSTVFIIAHDVVNAYFKGITDMNEIIAKFPEETRTGNFRKVIDTLIKKHPETK